MSGSSMRVPLAPAGGFRSALAAERWPTSTTSVGKPSRLAGTASLWCSRMAANEASFSLTKKTTLSPLMGSPRRALAPWPAATMFGSLARRRPSANATSEIVFDAAIDCSALIFPISSRKLDLKRIDHVLDSRHHRAARAHRISEPNDLPRPRRGPERARPPLPRQRRARRVGDDHHLVEEEERACR